MPKKAKNQESRSTSEWSYENASGRYEEKQPEDKKGENMKKFLHDSVNLINESQKLNKCETKEDFNEQLDIAAKTMKSVIEYVKIKSDDPNSLHPCIECGKLCCGYWYVNKLLKIRIPLPFSDDCVNKNENTLNSSLITKNEKIT